MRPRQNPKRGQPAARFSGAPSRLVLSSRHPCGCEAGEEVPHQCSLLGEPSGEMRKDPSITGSRVGRSSAVRGDAEAAARCRNNRKNHSLLEQMA